MIVPDLSQNIVARDFLTQAVSSANEGIDVILGGPPFVRLQQMLHSDPAAVERYKREFRTARSGQFDLYILFIEKAIDLLAPNGWLAFSVSNTFLRSETGRVLRQLVGDQCQVHDIIEFEDPKIYPDAVIQIALVLLQKSAIRGPGRHVWVRGKGLLREKLSALATHSSHACVETRPLLPQIIRSDRWFFQSTDEADLLARIQAAGTPLGRLPDLTSAKALSPAPTKCSCSASLTKAATARFSLSNAKPTGDSGLKRQCCALTSAIGTFMAMPCQHRPHCVWFLTAHQDAFLTKLRCGGTFHRRTSTYQQTRLDSRLAFGSALTHGMSSPRRQHYATPPAPR